MIELLGSSPVFEEMKVRARQVLARAGAGGRLPPVLIQGETGTGKGLLARTLHLASPRAGAPFVAINCGAITETLGESEFFGFVRGAHSEARQPRKGFFEAADRGVLLLDEVGLLSEGHQARLLKVVEDRQVIPVGSTKPIPVDVWLISVTNADLWGEVQGQKFRRDLYERLAVMTFTLPPLRERPGDIVELAQQFLARSCKEYGLTPKTLAPDAQRRLLEHPWPGNVRELSNVIERAMFLVDGDVISADRLELMAPTAPASPQVKRPAAGAGDRRQRIADALERQGGNITKTAADLGISRKTLRDWMKQENLYTAGRQLDRASSTGEPETAGHPTPKRGVAEPGRSPSSLVQTPFVGRVRELAALERWLQDATRGDPRVVLLQGDAGIGKTRLLQEALSTARRLGMQICSGRFHEDLTLPYLPFVEGLLPRLEAMPDYVRQSIDADIRTISQLHRVGRTDQDPARRSQSALSRPPASYPSSAAKADHDRVQIFVSISRAIVTLAQCSPMVMVVDDLHWADRLSLDLFDHVVFTVADMVARDPVPVIIIGSHRPVGQEDRLARLIGRIGREQICRTLTLEGLNEQEIRELIGGLGLERPSHQLTTTVSEATQGNPLFVQEVVHHLIHERALEDQGGYLVAALDSADLRLPDHVTGAIVTHARALSEPAQRVLTFAAFLGDRFPFETLGAVSGMADDDLLDVLEETEQQRLLRSDGETVQFMHPLIRQVCYQEPSALRRQRLHKHIAQTLQRLYADAPDAHLLTIAHHFVRAGKMANAETVVDYARRAGAHGFRVFAWSEAAQYYEAALSAAESSGSLSVRELADIHYWAGLAHYHDQDVGPCVHHYQRAIAAYRLAGDVRGMAQALLEKTRTGFTLAALPLGALADVKPLEEVLTSLGDEEPELRGHVAAVMAEVYRNARHAEESRKWARHALDLGRQIADDHLCAHASYSLGQAHIHDLEATEAVAAWEGAVVHARRAGDVIREGWALHRIPLALTLLGRLNEAAAVAVAACEVTRRSQDWGNQSVGLSHLSAVAVAQGNFDLAERRAHESMLMVSRSHYPWGGFRALLALACARAVRGAGVEADDALDLLVEPGKVFADPGQVIPTFALILRRLRRAYADAGEETEPLPADVLGLIGSDTYSLAPLCALVELADTPANTEIAERAYQSLARAAERGLLFSSGWMFLIPRVLGVAARVKGQFDLAEAHFQTAVEAATRVGARPELARTYLDQAELLIAQGGTSHRSRIVELLKEAAAIFLDFGMQPFARRSARLAQELGVSIPTTSPGRSVYPDDLSHREVDVLVQMTRGRTREEIAADLVLRPQTVAGHLASIFDKTRVSDEATAASYAREKGLAGPVDRRRRSAPEERDDRAARAPRIILVSDIVASDALISHSGDTKAQRLFRIHSGVIRECLDAHHGAEVTHTGEGIEASFSSASAAVECAIAIQKAFARRNPGDSTEAMQVRIGINAGEPVTAEGRLFGAAVQIAFGICGRAKPGQIFVADAVAQLLADNAYRLVDRGPFTFKGLSRIGLAEVLWQSDDA